jgi:TPR repeat protein
MKLKLFIILSLFSCNLFASDFFNEELKLYNELTSAFDTGFYPGCVEKTEILEQKYPESTFLISSRLKKGESLLKLGRFNHAKEVLLNSIPLMYSGTEELSNCYFLLGQTLYFQNDYEQSLNYFYKVCENSLLNKKMDFYNPSVLYSARIYFLQNEYEKSIPLLEYVLQNGKNYSMNEYEEVLQKYFISCVKSNQNSKVIDLFQKIDLSKFSSDVVLNLTFYAANAYEENKDFENAFNLYKKIIDSRDSSLLSATIARLEKMIKSNKLSFDLADIFSELKSDNSYNEILSGYWLRL